MILFYFFRMLQYNLFKRAMYGMHWICESVFYLFSFCALVPLFIFIFIFLFVLFLFLFLFSYTFIFIIYDSASLYFITELLIRNILHHTCYFDLFNILSSAFFYFYFFYFFLFFSFYFYFFNLIYFFI